MLYVEICHVGTPTAPEERQRPGNVSNAAAAPTTLLVARGGSLEYLEPVCFDDPALTAFPSPLELRRVDRLTR